MSSENGWLDSTVVLPWIRGGGKHKQLIANRVNKIQSHPQIRCCHVPIRENPADLGSRGGKVKGDKLWWKGWHWLSQNEQWPPDVVSTATKESDAKTKVVKQIFASTIEVPNDSFNNLLTKFDMSKTLRVCAWASRLLFNIRNQNQRVKGFYQLLKSNRNVFFWIKRIEARCDLEEDRLRLNLQ